MSKELENVLKAYNQVEEFISEMPLSYKGHYTLGASEYISDRLNEIEGALNEYVKLKQTLTPPTADEVCKALSDYYGFDYYYQDKFFYKSDGVKYIYPLKVSGFTEIQLYDGHLPPHLITLIGRFYEGESK